ncbi:ArsC/Spx/MgsR family protein [Fulvivirgaceae bacterium BMA10]|uniref:ArsC/Spx/MgsR family protein n=1 Tax=Splendidivirga corallicola TaxID=3051826 RepID=A0ABT8KV43_9BACT|nr:ArsC/Spx/MgsR family protein [Fulvivirgaceae bacterium BMA10]
MEHHPNELFIYYDGNSRVAKQTRAYARAVSNHVNEMDYKKVRLTPTLWEEMLSLLKLRPKDLLNKAHPRYQEKVARRSFDPEGWLNILLQNPDLIKAPIAIKNRKAILCIKPTDILKIA